MPLIIACRFIPGGRTAVTVACGLTGYSRRKFAAGTGAAAVIWVLYAFWLGRLGGRAFEDLPWAGFALAAGTDYLPRRRPCPARHRAGQQLGAARQRRPEAQQVRSAPKSGPA